ncbi:hypothetical protein [Longispora albida]|uniref:COG1470 family protein n=1 Tax=Longispora albida TaxID=203523 RepID=UPI00039D41CD|nr:hypothetical protein [Longispora albida]
MTTQAVLASTVLEVVPGGQVTCELTLRNNGTVVEEYRFEIAGDAAPWTTTEPPVVSLYPGSETTVLIVFQPPRSARVPAGDVPFAVRVMPGEHPELGVAPEGVIRVLPYADLTAEIIPRTSKGRRARHEVAIDNRGNLPIVANLTGADPDDKLTVTPRPGILTVAPGEAVFATVIARARRRHWRGEPLTHPFHVIVSTEDTPPITLDAAIVQSAVFSRGAMRALAALVALVIACVAAWYLLLKPAVKTTARESVKEPLSQVAGQAAAAEKKADEALAKSGGGGGGGTPTPAPSPSTSVPPKPVDAGYRYRLETTVTNGATGTSTLTLGAKTSLSITDLVFEAPQGDAGKIELLVDGSVLMTLSPANFRDLDYHFGTPIEVPAGKTVVLRSACQTAGPALVGTSSGSCRTWVLLTGISHTAP